MMIQKSKGLPESVAELCGSLVAIPSVNPDGDPHADPSICGEKACAEAVGAFLATCGALVTFEEPSPGRPNVIGRFPHSRGKEGLPRVLFAPHTDTVSITGMTIPPFSGEIRDGRVWGRGASDTKGTMAAMLWAFREMGERIGELNVEVGFVGLVGEESGQLGARHFASHHGDEYDFALVGEPTGLDVVYTHKGCHWYTLETKGVAAHGATPERGENAITALLKVLTALDVEFRAELAEYRDAILGPATVNIGLIEGGSRPNIVPDRCWAVVDFRETPALEQAGGINKIFHAFLKRHGFASTVSVSLIQGCGPLFTDPGHAMMNRLTSLGSTLAGAPWLCDGAWLAKGGIPSVAVGPGSIAQAHTVDEWVRVEDLEKGAAYYRSFLESFST